MDKQRMDKDVEILGKERLARVKRRRRLAAVLMSLAVIVLSVTVYRLIQPASANDQDMKEYTVEINGANDTSTYKNLSKLTTTPTLEATGDDVTYEGGQYELKASITFPIAKDEGASFGDNYYYTYPSSIFIPESLMKQWYTYTDTTGTDAFDYRFVKNDDGTYSVLIRFYEGYLANSDVEGTITFKCKAEGRIDDKGDLVIDCGGDVTIKVDKEKIKWDGKESANYDITLDKVANDSNSVLTDENGNKYIEYTLNISSTKGTPDVVTVSDTFNGSTLSILDLSSVKAVLVKNGKEVSTSDYSYTMSYTENSSTQCAMTATLPKLGAGESYALTYRYYLDTTNASNGSTWVNNSASASSENSTTGEKVKDSDGTTVSYKKELLEKSGTYDETTQKITWTVTVNKEKTNIAGAEITDNMFANASDVKVSPSNGYTINKDGDKISSIKFTATNGSTNTNTYTITYTTPYEQSSKDQTVNNTVVINKDGKEWGKGTGSVKVPAEEWNVSKTLSSADANGDKTYTLNWSVTFDIPKHGILEGSWIRDTLTSYGGGEHYMTYAQFKNLADQVTVKFGDSVGNVRAQLLDGSTVAYSNMDASKDYKIVKFEAQFTSYYAYQGESSATFNYSSTADTTGGGQITFKNAYKIQDHEASADWKNTSSKITKTDGNGTGGTTTIKKENCDGTLTWKVNVLLDKDATKYEVTDVMPQGVTVKSVSFKLKYGSVAFTYPKTDGTVYNSDDISTGWVKGNLTTSTEIVNQSGRQVVTTAVEKPDNVSLDDWAEASWIELTYVVDIDDFENMAEGDVLTFENTASAKSNTNENIGSSSQTQVVTWPKKDDGKSEVEDDKEISKTAKWDNDQRKLKYTVTINPDGKDLVKNCETLNLEDVLKYEHKTWQATWKVDLMPGTVKLYYATKQDDGTYKKDKQVTDWNWEYSEVIGEGEWATDTKTIKATVPDGCTLILEYTYVVTANVDAAQEDNYKNYGISITPISNTVSLNGVSKGDSSTKTEEKYAEVDTSASIYKSNEYIFYKYESGNMSKLLSGAQFVLYKYDPNSTEAGKTADGYVPIKTYATGDDGKFTVSFKNDGLTYNTQYYVVETKSPDGYILPDKVKEYYFYFANTNTSSYPITAANDTFTGKNLANDYAIEYVSNEKIPTTSINVEKIWIDSTGSPIDPTNSKIYLQVRRVDSEGNDEVYLDGVEITPNENGDWKYTLENLPLSGTDENGVLTGVTYKYYVKETGVDENHEMKGYTVSYTYKDADGNTISEFNENIAPTKTDALDGGTVEITNKLNTYELPQTGGSGNRWLYTLSGIALLAVAGIALLYKRNFKHI